MKSIETILEFLGCQGVRPNEAGAWAVTLSNGQTIVVETNVIAESGLLFPWRVDGQFFDDEERAGMYLTRRITEKLTGKRIILHKKEAVPFVCGKDGAACRAPGKCNTALCLCCPVGEKFFADRDGLELIYAVD